MHCKRVGKTSGTMLSIKEQWQKKKNAVLRRVPENAVATAKLAVSQRRRRPMWESEGEALSEDDSVSSTSSESNTCKDALHVVGFHGPSDKISLFLKYWELAQVAPSCHMALNVLCQDMHEAWETCGCQMSLVIKKGRKDVNDKFF